MAENSVNENLDRLAREALSLTKNTLRVNFRFLDAALGRFILVNQSEIPLATDAYHMFFDAKHVLSLFSPCNSKRPLRQTPICLATEASPKPLRFNLRTT